MAISTTANRSVRSSMAHLGVCLSSASAEKHIHTHTMGKPREKRDENDHRQIERQISRRSELHNIYNIADKQIGGQSMTAVNAFTL